jgi:ABC-2 type transport system permease protein
MKKWENLLTFSALVLAVILLNMLAARWFFRWDLTEDKRYSITPTTQNLLKNLDEVVTIQVYLTGDLNADFRRLKNEIEENLEEFKVYGGEKIQYEFVNPEDIANPEEKKAFYQSLLEKGMQPTNLYDNVDGKKIQKIIFPYASVSYKGREQAVLLLKGNVTATAKEKLNQSIEGVEYELASSIKSLSKDEKPFIAIVEGHNELDNNDIADFTESLQASYSVERVNLLEKNLDGYDAVIVAQPKKPFQEIEKYRIDQFVMQGGKALFFLDAVQMNLDSIPLGGTYAFGYDLGIEDMLFRYGVRINQDLVQDMFMGNILVNVGKFGEQANLQALPFPYYIALNQFGKHPTVRNLNAVYARFASSMDTVEAQGIRKTPLLFTNKYSRIRRMPNMLTLDELKADLNKELYTQKYIPVLYLLEGKFTSVYKNRFSPDGSTPTTESSPNKIIVCSDGDLLRNEINKKNQQILPLGYDPITQQTFANKQLVMNLLDYLLDDEGLITTRNKEVKLRPLDTFKVQEEKTMWQTLNIVVPVLVVVLLGVGRYYWRRKKYA